MYLSSFEVCILLAFIPHPISLFPVICFEVPINRTSTNSNFFSVYLKGSSYQEWTVCASAQKQLASIITNNNFRIKSHYLEVK